MSGFGTLENDEEHRKRYRMQDLGIESLLGRKVLDVKINEEKDLVILITETGNVYLTWEGDCCAHCFIAHVEGSEALRGASILEVENAEWKEIQEGDEGETVESMGTKIKTDKGYVTFESRVEHNGYYGGNIFVSNDEPMDQYACPRYEEGYLPKLLPLQDF